MRPVTERLSQAVKILVIADAVLFFFAVLVPPANLFFKQHLALGPGMMSGELWQPFTALFVHLDPISFLFNMVGLWWVGASVERSLGTRKFLALFFIPGVVANVVIGVVAWQLGMPQLYAGCGTAVLGLFVAFGTMFDRTPTRIIGGLVLEARVLVAILVGFALVANLVQGTWPWLAGDVAAAIIGYGMAGGRGEGLRRMWGGMRAKRSRRRYQVLEGGRRGPKPTDLN
jgi:membrane associated rhomboid family serine protease